MRIHLALKLVRRRRLHLVRRRLPKRTLISIHLWRGLGGGVSKWRQAVEGSGPGARGAGAGAGVSVSGGEIGTKIGGDGVLYISPRGIRR